MSVWATIRVVLAKELTDGLRDRRSLASALLFPLVGPILIAIMFTSIVEDQVAEGPLRVPVVGAAHAPGLVRHLEESDVVLEDPPADPAAAVSRGEVAMVLVVPADAERSVRSGKPVELELVVDRSRRDVAPMIARLEARIDAYSGKLASLRLLARGIHPDVVRPLVVRDVDVSTPQRRAANLLNVVPMFVMLAAFIGGMFLATDGTAGERERKSLEPLLLNPVSRRGLVVGKWLATAVLSVTSATVTLVGSAVALSRVPLDEIGLPVRFELSDASVVMAAIVPLCLLAAAVQLVVASFARSFREAQTYLSLLTLAPTLPGVLLVLRPLQTEPWMFAVPILGQQTLFLDVLRAEPTAGWAHALAAASALALAGVSVLVTAWLFDRESTLFGD
jgi:sodium transport system permease protein